MRKDNRIGRVTTTASVHYSPLNVPFITKADLQREPAKPPAKPLAKPPAEREILPRAVRWDKEGRKYIARPKYNRNRYYLGRFYTAKEAGEAVREFRKTHPLPSLSLAKANQKPQGGTSKYKGICKHEGKWKAGIRVADKKKHLGYFPLTKAGEKQAALAYDKMAIEKWGKDVKCNQYWFPEDFGLSPVI